MGERQVGLSAHTSKLLRDALTGVSCPGGPAAAHSTSSQMRAGVGMSIPGGSNERIPFKPATASCCPLSPSHCSPADARASSPAESGPPAARTAYHSAASAPPAAASSCTAAACAACLSSSGRCGVVRQRVTLSCTLQGLGSREESSQSRNPITRLAPERTPANIACHMLQAKEKAPPPPRSRTLSGGRRCRSRRTPAAPWPPGRPRPPRSQVRAPPHPAAAGPPAGQDTTQPAAGGQERSQRRLG